MKKLICFLAMTLPYILAAQPSGQLDITFGDHGISVVDHKTFETLSDVAIQPDGKIVTAGLTEENFHSQIAVVRYLPDGQLDAGFGIAGIYAGRIEPTSNIATCLALQPDGKILVGGYFRTEQGVPNGEDLFLLRLDAQGNPDSTFSNDGFATLGYSDHERAVSIKAGPDNKIYVAGNSFTGLNSHILVSRYNMDGTPDQSFGTAGTLFPANSTSTWNYCYDMILQPDGKILLAAESNSFNSGSNITMIRLNPNGEFDATFNGDGKTTNSLGSKDDIPLTLELLPDGKILLGGSSVGADGKTNFALVRYTANGYFDNDFGNLGKVITPLEGGYGAISDICVTSQGEIIAVGTAKNTCSLFDWVVAKYSAGGVLQTDFAEQGFLYTDYKQHNDGVGKAQWLDNGKLIVVGSGVNPSSSISDFLVARYVFDENVGTKDLSTLSTTTRVFPNPVSNGVLTFQFNLPEASEVAIDLYSLNGQLLGSLFHQPSVAGSQTASVNLPSDLAKGCYLASIRTDSDRTFVTIIVQ